MLEEGTKKKPRWRLRGRYGPCIHFWRWNSSQWRCVKTHRRYTYLSEWKWKLFVQRVKFWGRERWGWVWVGYGIEILQETPSMVGTLWTGAGPGTERGASSWADCAVYSTNGCLSFLQLVSLNFILCLLFAIIFCAYHVCTIESERDSWI